MHEASKAAKRRYEDGAFHSRYFVGRGIDIGGGPDPLGQYAGIFRGITGVVTWDLEQGDAQLMAGVADASFDFVHASHCLEHMRDPYEALQHWLRILKPGGHLIITIPDEDLYEQGRWPSDFNADHKWSFTLFKPASSMPRSVNVIDLLRHFGDQVECERMVLQRDFFRESLVGLDQTQTLVAECAIEFIWRKRPAPARTGATVPVPAAAPRQPLDEIQAWRQRIASNPLDFDAYNALAHLLTMRNALDEVETVWTAAREAMPDAHLPKIYQALFLMQRGKLAEGFRLREDCVPDAVRSKQLPPADWRRWQGEALDGRHVTIWSEFGYGDEIMFARFAEVLRSRGARRVELVCQTPLKSLFAGMPGCDRVVSLDDIATLEPPDYWVFPHSIPVHLPLTVETIPAPVPYLRADAERLRAWRQSLPGVVPGGLRVGLAWLGNATHENDAYRSIHDAAVLNPLLGTEDARFVSLQADERTLLPGMARRGGPLDDFTDTAALIAALDLVITVDTAVAHLAGALGREVWLLLPAVSDWRWMLQRDDSPWYPTMRLFRQSRLGDWEGPIERMCAALRLKLASRGAPSTR